MRLARALFALVALASWAAQSMASELVVIASTDPSVRTGTIVDGNQTMRVVPKAAVVLISATGERIALSGPYSGAPQPSASKSDNRLVESLAQLINEHADAPEKLAAFRSADKQPPTPRHDIWGIDIARAGAHCLRADRDVMLWWAGAREGAVVALSGPSEDAHEVRIRWPTGRRHLPWPQELAFADSARYLVRFRATDPGVALNTLQMPALDTDAARASWMAEHGCTQQALDVLNGIAKNELAPGR